jgi:hypothetical protein
MKHVLVIVLSIGAVALPAFAEDTVPYVHHDSSSDGVAIQINHSALRENEPAGLHASHLQLFKRRLDDRFRESCHKRGIHLSLQAPICMRGALRTKD